MSTNRPRYEMSRAAQRLVLACLVLAGAMVCVSLTASDARAQSLLEFDRWMQKIEKRNLSMHRNLKRLDGAAAAADAREIKVLYQLMEEFFAKRGDARDALKLSRDGGELAEQVARSAVASDFDTARTAAIALARACRDCHQDYKPLE